MITLTPEQRDAVDRDGDLLLTACPGSGKTRVILAKLLKLADQVVGTPPVRWLYHLYQCRG